MVILLVLATFLTFILLDWLLSRNKAAAPVAERFVDGFIVREGISYHPGHSWLARERRHLVRIGADEFAAALAGNVEKIELPRLGQWIRQGQKAWAFVRDRQKAEMVSPTEGEVIEVNQDLAADPSLLRRDPYGQGWIALVDVPDEESTTRNLVPAAMVRNWMRDAVNRLYAKRPQPAGAVADVPDADWKEVAGEFFLTGAKCGTFNDMRILK